MSKILQNKKNLIAVGARIRKIRQAKGLTLVESEELGPISWQHLQKIESGLMDVRLSTIFTLAKMFKIHPSEFFTD
jgi:transcriptional regulator with XRE-family HTH domain